MSIRKILNPILLSSLSAAIMLSSVLQPPAAEAIQRGGVVSVVSLAEPQLLNPVFDSSPAAEDMYNLIFSALIKENSRSELEPDLVQTVPTAQNGMVKMHSDGSMSVTYRLRPNLKWHDGKALTSADIHFTWQSHTDPAIKYPPTPGYEQIKSVEVLDELTATVHFHRAYGEYYRLFRQVLPRHAFRSQFWQFSPEHPYNKHPVGSGPFVLKQWTRGQSAWLEANPVYYRSRPMLDQIRYSFKNNDYRSIKQVLNWVEEGEIVQGMSLASYEYLKNRPDLNLHVVADGQIEHLIFNLKHPVLADRRVRRALAYATDRKAISDLLLGVTEAAYSDQLKDSWKYHAASERMYAADLNQARTQLQLAGWRPAETQPTNGQPASEGPEPVRQRDGKTLQLVLTLEQGNRSHALVAKYLQENWARIGVDLKVKFVAPRVLHDDILPQSDFELAFGTWTQHPGETAYNRWHSSQVPPQGKNHSHFKDYQVDELVRELQGSVNLRHQKQLYQKLGALLAEELPVLPLYYGAQLEANHKRLHNYAPNAYMGTTWNSFAWWIEPRR